MLRLLKQLVCWHRWRFVALVVTPIDTAPYMSRQRCMKCKSERVIYT